MAIACALACEVRFAASGEAPQRADAARPGPDAGSGDAGGGVPDAGSGDPADGGSVPDAGGASDASAADAAGPDGSARPIDLEANVEMIAFTMTSQVSTVAYASSQTSLDPAAYDGTVTFAFEIVARNLDVAAREVRLIDSLAQIRASLFVPARTTSYTRLRLDSFAPNPGRDVYRLELDGTAGATQLAVSAARIVVQQRGATRTRLYWPLVSGPTLDLNALDNADNGGATSYSQADPVPYGIFLKEPSAFGALAGPTPWTFEAAIASDDLSPSWIALFDRTTGIQVNGSEVSTVQRQYELVSGVLPDAVLPEGHEFEVRVRTSSWYYVAKAGLWVALSPVTAGQVVYRLAGTTGVYDGSYVDEPHRALLDFARFSGPTATYFEAVGRQDPTDRGVHTFFVTDGGASDVGVAGRVTVPGSALVLPATKQRLRSGPLSLTAGNRFMAEANIQAGNDELCQAMVIVKFQ